ncbi:MAG: Crp/Fnr family transcriptional regulator, partial [Bacteroidota bacterium]
PIRSVEKNTTLLSEGDVSTSFFFLIEGYVRMYYLVDGVEKTTFFYEQDQFISSYESFIRQSPARHYIQTLSKVKIATFHLSKVNEILQKFPHFDFLARLIMEEEMGVLQDMIASFVTMNAEQRYQKLVNTKPHLLQQVPQYHIATYLGVSPETLSRIRSRLSGKGIY